MSLAAFHKYAEFKYESDSEEKDVDRNIPQ